MRDQTLVKADRSFIHSVRKCFQVLECLGEAQRPLSFTELVQASRLERSAVQRLVHTLAQLGYLRQHPRTRAYTLSPRLLQFSYAALQVDPVAEAAEPYLQKLNQQCKETVNLMELESSDIVYVLRYPSFHAVSVDLHVGSRLPVHCTAAGRVFMAHMVSEELEALLALPRPKLTEHTITDEAALRQILTQVRQQGYCLNNQEAFLGDISIAAPLFDRHREVVGAINIAVAFPRWTVPAVRKKLVPLLLETAQKITQQLTRST